MAGDLQPEPVAAKHDMFGFTKTIALETAEGGTTVNAICPGDILTPLLAAKFQSTAKTRGIIPDEVKREIQLAAQATVERQRNSSRSRSLLHLPCS